MKNIDPNTIGLQINEIEVLPPNPSFPHYGCIRITWQSSIGFGTYDLWMTEDGKWHGDSETMDNNEDKDFLKKLLQLWVEKITIG